MTDLYDPKNLSPWQDGKPYRVGVYELDYADNEGRAFSHWNGSWWGCVLWEGECQDSPQNAIKKAYQYRYAPSEWVHGKTTRYRGLLFNPEEKKP